MAGELAAEWIRVPDGNGGLKKVWVRDSTARRDVAQLQTDLAQLQTDVGGLVIPDPSDANPQMDGTAAAGSSADYSRADHVHPSDTSKADAATTLAGYGITDAYTKTQVDGMIPSVPSAYTSNPEMDGTASPGSSTAWARGDHVHPHDSTKADASAIPTKTSDLTNDSGFLTSAPVASVNGQTGAVSLDASDVGALPDSTTIPAKTSDLVNDSGFITSGKFAVVSGTVASAAGYSTAVSLPTGFTIDNCVALGFQVYNGSEWRIPGDGVFTTTSRIFARITSSGVEVYSNQSSTYSQPWKMALMRTDI